MGGVLLGFALGAMAFTAQGRELGNKVGAAAIDRAKKVMNRLGEAAMAQAKKVMDRAKEPAEQSAGAAGDHRHPG